MSPEAEAVLHFEVRRVITGFSVQPAGHRRWGVVDSRGANPKWLTGPLPFHDALMESIRLESEAIIQLIKELAPDARAAD